MTGMNDARQFHAAGIYGKSLFITGGSKKLPDVLNSVEIYNLNNF